MVAIEELPTTASAAATATAKHPSSSDPTIPTTTRTQDAVDQFNTMFQDMNDARQALVDSNEYDPDSPLTQAIEVALAQGRGWGPGEKQAYLERILADDFIPPLFASNEQEVANMGLTEAFTTLQRSSGDDPALYMEEFKKKGNKAFADGKLNQVKNVQYYRDAINRYYEALAWSEQVPTTQEAAASSSETAHMTVVPPAKLATFQSAVYSNIALCHTHLSNWGLCRSHAQRALEKDPTNGKAQYRLANALVKLQDWEAAGAAMEHGIQTHPEAHKDFVTLQAKAGQQIQKARKLRQQRERARAQRVANIKAVYQHCQQASIQLGRIPIVVDDDDDDDDTNTAPSSIWHHHLPHSGLLPSIDDSGTTWSWPCLFVYPSHQQSDLITHFPEDEMLAVRMADVFPELEDDDDDATTRMPWDTEHVFTCSQLAVYFQVHAAATTTIDDDDSTTTTKRPRLHPDAVHPLTDQASCMRFYEATRALQGNEGVDIGTVVRHAELQHRRHQQAAWRQAYGSLYAQAPGHSQQSHDVVRVHPAMTLLDILQDPRMIVPNFLVTLLFLPDDHPAHSKFLKEHTCIGILQPTTTDGH